MIGPVALSLGGAVALRHRVDPVLVTPIGVAGLTLPLPTAAGLFLWWAVARFRRSARLAATRRAEAAGALEAAELLGLGLTGGLSVAAAHRLALDHAPHAVAPALRSLVSRMSEQGITAALDADSGPLAGSSAVLAAASASGAPVIPALHAHVVQEHHRRHTEAVERARRLPIRLLIPLTLLVLPGFVLITVGPTVADSLARLAP